MCFWDIMNDAAAKITIYLHDEEDADKLSRICWSSDFSPTFWVITNVATNGKIILGQEAIKKWI